MAPSSVRQSPTELIVYLVNNTGWSGWTGWLVWPVSLEETKRTPCWRAGRTRPSACRARAGIRGIPCGTAPAAAGRGAAAAAAVEGGGTKRRTVGHQNQTASRRTATSGRANGRLAGGGGGGGGGGGCRWGGRNTPCAPRCVCRCRSRGTWRSRRRPASSRGRSPRA